MWPQILRLNFSNLIGLLLSINVDRFHLDVHPILTMDQLSSTSISIFMCQSNSNSLTVGNSIISGQKTIHITTASR